MCASTYSLYVIIVCVFVFKYECKQLYITTHFQTTTKEGWWHIDRDTKTTPHNIYLRARKEQTIANAGGWRRLKFCSDNTRSTKCSLFGFIYADDASVGRTRFCKEWGGVLFVVCHCFVFVLLDALYVSRECWSTVYPYTNRRANSTLMPIRVQNH